MKFHELNVAANKNRKRAGRGIAAGRGKTAGRGTKGQKARTGASQRPGFEGGQNPLMQRLPKLRGFKSFKPKATNVYTDQLVDLKAKAIDATALAEAGLVANPYQKIKLLKRGDLTKAITVKLPAASQAAKDAVVEAGGSFETVERLQRPVTSAKKSSKQDK